MNKRDFENYMNQFRLEYKTGKDPTHTLLGPIFNKRGSFKIPDEKLDNFYEAYHKFTFESKNPCYLTERPTEKGGILKFDFDILYHSVDQTCERRFREDDALVFIEWIQEELKSILVNCEPENTICFLLFRPGPYCKGATKSVANNSNGAGVCSSTERPQEKKFIIKDGIHIMLPFLFLDYKAHHYLRRVLIQKSKEKNLKGVFHFENSYEEFIDEKVIEKSGWLMYGSTKEGVLPYRLCGVYEDCVRKNNEISTSYTDSDLVRLFSIRQVFPESPYKLPKQQFENLSREGRINTKLETNKRKENGAQGLEEDMQPGSGNNEALLKENAPKKARTDLVSIPEGKQNSVPMSTGTSNVNDVEQDFDDWMREFEADSIMEKKKNVKCATSANNKLTVKEVVQSPKRRNSRVGLHRVANAELESRYISSNTHLDRDVEIVAESSNSRNAASRDARDGQEEPAGFQLGNMTSIDNHLESLFNVDTMDKINRSDRPRSDKIDFLRKVIILLSPKRALDYHMWIQVGLCLHNCRDTAHSNSNLKTNNTRQQSMNMNSLTSHSSGSGESSAGKSGQGSNQGRAEPDEADLEVLCTNTVYFQMWLQFSKQSFEIYHENMDAAESNFLEKICEGKVETRETIQNKYINNEQEWEDDLRERWMRFKTRTSSGLNYGSLLYWAKQDSPKEYQELVYLHSNGMMKETLYNPSHKKLAAILYRKYEGQFVCTDYEKNIWYEWNKHCWVRMDGVSSIRRKITGTCTDQNSLITDFLKMKNMLVEEKMTNNVELDQLKKRVQALKQELQPKQLELQEFKSQYGHSASLPELQKSVKELSTEFKSAKDEHDKLVKEIIKLYIKPFDEIIQKYLETSTSIDNIVKEAKQEFFDAEFNRKLNANPLLFLFNNGVYDLEEMVFRDGIPSDYLSIENNLEQIDYREFDLDQDARIIEIQQYFQQVITDPLKREFFLTLIASCLEGYNTNNLFPILTGSGSNAKSLTISFIEDCFGLYSGKLNPAFLTQKRNKSNTASPEYYNIVDCRIVSSEESDMSDELNTAIIKEITGNSKITSRTLFQPKMTTKIPQFIPFLICNDLPNVKSMDGGTWRRIVVISFDSKFVDNPHDPKYALSSNDVKIFQIDRNIKKRMAHWKEAFMYLLIHRYYRMFKANDKNLAIPDCVKAFTEKYKDDNDILQPFIEMFVIVTGNKTDTIKLKELYNKIILWFRENYQGEKEPTQQTIKKYFEQKFGAYDSRGWIGKKLST
jgi:phage/plasmid-associated DNA primase